MASIEIVGGTWDNVGGKPSKIVKNLTIGISLSNKFSRVVINNGGNYEVLSKVIESKPVPAIADVVVWMPDIPNDLPKLRGIKEIYPKSILVSSKNNVFTKYSFQDIVAHGLGLKSNLVLEIGKKHSRFTGRLIDTLGNVWCGRENSFETLGVAIANRSRDLMDITRQATIQSPERTDEITQPCMAEGTLEFLEIVKETAETFHKLISPAKGTTRFLGNTSFRCNKGFPSMRLENGRIYMSKRNVDKRAIDLNAFVQVGFNAKTDAVWYRGEHKPSVDTIVQVCLYRELSNINYMIHSHVYEKNAPFTSEMIPCGGLEEIDEVLKVISKNYFRGESHFAINLKGHGSIVFMNKPHDFEHFEFEARPMPEIM